jgi:hypothetical protein
MKRLFFGLMLVMLMVPVAYANVDVGTNLEVQNKSVTLYTLPDATSKVVTTVAQGQNLLTVFQQGDWVKVANPATGDVGWIKERDLMQSATEAGPVVHHYVITRKDANGNNQQTYQVTEFSSGVQNLNPQQAEQLIAQATQQQQQMQASLNKMMADMSHSFDDMQKAFWQNMPSFFIIKANPQPTATNAPAAAQSQDTAQSNTSTNK